MKILVESWPFIRDYLPKKMLNAVKNFFALPSFGHNDAIGRRKMISDSSGSHVYCGVLAISMMREKSEFVVGELQFSRQMSRSQQRQWQRELDHGPTITRFALAPTPHLLRCISSPHTEELSSSRGFRECVLDH